MKSLYDFIVKPVGEEYDNKINEINVKIEESIKEQQSS